MSKKSLDARARRAARRVGLEARKSRWLRESIDNYGGYMLVDPYSNFCMYGSRWSLSAEGVIEYCKSEAAEHETAAA